MPDSSPIDSFYRAFFLHILLAAINRAFNSKLNQRDYIGLTKSKNGHTTTGQNTAI